MTERWIRVDEGPLTHTAWAHWLSSDVPLDPYLIWADITQLKNSDRSAVKDRWPILVELTSNDGVEVPNGHALSGTCRPGAQCHPALGLLDIPGAYKLVKDATSPVRLASKYITATVPPTCIAELLCHPELIKRFQLGLPRIPRTEVEGSSKPQSSSGTRPRVVVGVIDDGFAFSHSQFRDPSGRARTCYVWDQDAAARGKPWKSVDEFGYGTELWHEDIQSAVNRSPLSGSPSPLAGLEAYGHLNYVPRRPNPDTLSTRLDEDTYGSVTKAPVGAMLSSTHGTSVMSLAAGRFPAVPAWHESQGQTPAQPTDADTANAWPLIFVQLPVRTTLDSSGGSLGVHVLDGMRYIFQRARTIADEVESEVGGCPPAFSLSQEPRPTTKGGAYFADNRVVINLSYGAIAGPHDGTSILEEAIFDLVVENLNVWVVLAAGNAHGSKTHVRLELEEGGAAKRLTWTVGPDNLLESYLEIWLPDCDTQGNKLDEAWLDTVYVSISPPGGRPSRVSTRGTGWSLVDGSDRNSPPVAAAIFCSKVAQGSRGTMVLLAVARTRRPLPGTDIYVSNAIAPHGDWIVEVGFGVTVAAPTRRRVVVHAWAERNDQLWGFVRKQQSTVVGDDPVPDRTEFSPSVLEFCARGSLVNYTDEVPRPFQPDVTNGSVANVPFASGLTAHRGSGVAVGGYRLSDQEMSSYSGGGPSRNSPTDGGRLPGGDCISPEPLPAKAVDGEPFHRDRGPWIDAPSDAGVALRGLRTIGLREGGVARVGGTSAAAPLVTRSIAADVYRLLPHSSECGIGTNAKRKMAKDSPLRTLEKSRRGSLTPTQDDRFRQGDERLTPVRKSYLGK